MHDIRFPFSNTPLFQITGQVNAYAPHLVSQFTTYVYDELLIVVQGITTDPYNDFLFSGGQDCRIRAWSLRNGDPISPTSPKLSAMNPSSLNSTDASPMSGNPLLRVFKEPVQTMQVTAERMGMCLWVGYGDKLCQFGLGRRGQGEESWQLWDESSVSPWNP
jgi:WD repeat-containing protein 21A